MMGLDSHADTNVFAALTASSCILRARVCEAMFHTLVNPNQLCTYEMTVQDNPFSEAQIFIATEDHDFVLPFSSKGPIPVVFTRTPIEKELQTCPHVTCLSAHEWDPHNVCVPKRSRTVEEYTARNIGAFMTEGVSPDLKDTYSDINSLYQIYDIATITSQMIGSFKVALIP